MVSAKKPLNENQNATAQANVKLIGETLGNFRIVEQLGRGGMGVVYKAYDRALDRTVALKVLPPNLAEDEDFIKRFIREARIAAKLEHPNIVPVYTANRSGSYWYIAMQFVRGKTLADYLKEKYRFSVRDALVITQVVCAALASAHRLGIVHRDIKPSNIMIDEEGKVKVMDFGLARAMVARQKITHTGLYLGTPEYSSPEQCESTVVDERADIYSTGVVLYELLSGRVPYVAETPLSLFKKITEEEPIPLKELNPQIPASVIKMVNKMMAKDKEKRYQSTAEVNTEINRILKSESLPVLVGAVRLQEAGEPKATPVTPVKTPGRRVVVVRKGLPVELAVFLTAAVVLVAVILILSALGGGREAPVTDNKVVRGENTSVNVVQPMAQVTTVVFDFQNVNNRSEAAWLEIAVPEMLIVNLNQCQGLTAIPRHNVINRMKGLGKRINLFAPDGVTFNPESNSLLKGVQAELVISGKFYMPNPPQVRITVSLDRYSPENPNVLQHIADCQQDSSDYNKDLLKIIDDLTVKITDSLKHKGPAYLARLGDIARAGTPDIKGLMVAQLDEANQVASYLMKSERSDMEFNRTRGGLAEKEEVLHEALATAPAPMPSAPPKMGAPGDQPDKSGVAANNDYQPAEQAGGGKGVDKTNALVRQMAKSKVANEKQDKLADDEKKLCEQKKLAKDQNNMGEGSAVPEDLLMRQIKEMYENIQQIEEQEFRR